MPHSDRGAETTERTHEAELPRLRAPAGQSSTAFPAGQVPQTERTSLADDALFVLDGPGVAGGSTIGTFNGHLLTALGGGGKTSNAFHTDATVASTWESFFVLKSGDLGSGYRYGIRPAGTGGPGEVVNFLTAIGGGGRGANNYPAVTHAQDPRPRARSNVFSIDLCKGVSR